MAKYDLSATEVEILPMNPKGTDLARQRHNEYLCNRILTQARKDDEYEGKIYYKSTDCNQQDIGCNHYKWHSSKKPKRCIIHYKQGNLPLFIHQIVIHIIAVSIAV